MLTSTRIARNTGFLLAAEIVTRLISLVIVVLMTRFLGDTEFGKYSFAVAFIGVFLIFADMGITPFMIREISRDRVIAKKYFDNAFTLKLVLAAIVLVAAALTIVLTGSDMEIVSLIILVGTYLMINEITQPIRAVFNAYERLEFYSMLVVIERIVALAAGAWLLFNGYGVVPFVLSFIVSYSVSFVAGVFFMGKSFLRPGLDFDLGFIKQILVKSFPFFLTTVFMGIYSRVDTLMLGFMTNFSVVGWYSAAFRIVESFNFIPYIFLGAVFPVMSRFYKASDSQLRILYSRTAYYLAIQGLPMAVGITLIAARVINLIYPQEFSGAVPVLQILIWAELFIFLNFLTGYLLNSINKAFLFTLSTAITTLANVILNFALISKYSLVGAAIATLISQLVSFVLLNWFAARNGYRLEILGKVWKPAISSAVMGAVIIISSGLSLYLIIPLAGISYFIVLFLVKGIGREEVGLVTSVVRGQG